MNTTDMLNMVHGRRQMDLVSENFINLYSPKLSVDSVTSSGLLVDDLNGKTVGIVTGEIRSGMVHCSRPYAQANVVALKTGVFIGWAKREKFLDADDRFLIRVDALNAMPEKLLFSETCPHMSVHGGFYDRESDSWRCFGCDQSLVFTEN